MARSATAVRSGSGPLGVGAPGNEVGPCLIGAVAGAAGAGRRRRRERHASENDEATGEPGGNQHPGDQNRA